MHIQQLSLKASYYQPTSNLFLIYPCCYLGPVLWNFCCKPNQTSACLFFIFCFFIFFYCTQRSVLAFFLNWVEKLMCAEALHCKLFILISFPGGKILHHPLTSPFPLPISSREIPLTLHYMVLTFHLVCYIRRSQAYLPQHVVRRAAW